MEIKEIYNITKFGYVDDDDMIFIVKINIIKLTIIIEGYYKFKIEGKRQFRLLSSIEYSLKESEETLHFDDIIENLVNDIYEKLEFVNTVEKIFKNVDKIVVK